MWAEPKFVVSLIIIFSSYFVFVCFFLIPFLPDLQTATNEGQRAANKSKLSAGKRIKSDMKENTKELRSLKEFHGFCSPFA